MITMSNTEIVKQAQQLANVNKRNTYVYLLKDGSKIVSFFQYKQGDLYGGLMENEIKKLLKTFVPKQIK